VWEYFTNPTHISNWAFASPDWEAKGKTNDMRVGGAFKTRMQAKDGSAGFDFIGTYTKIEPLNYYEYVLADGRIVHVTFADQGEHVEIIETFDPEQENSEELQRSGWQAFLDNFKRYVEST
jgi:uncharacterized protein YndB with AHSA1/START domain